MKEKPLSKVIVVLHLHSLLQLVLGNCAFAFENNLVLSLSGWDLFILAVCFVLEFGHTEN